METRIGRRIHVRAPYGELIHEVRLSFDGAVWQARIVTLPRQIWVAPGGGRALTFEATGPEAAEARAVEFIERERIARGHRLIDPHRTVGGIGGEEDPARRVIVQFPIRFVLRGAIRTETNLRPRAGTTTNLSETGIFIATEDALFPGSRVTLDLRLPGAHERLEAVVVWSCTSSGSGRPAGMGVRLETPSLSYRSCIQSLGRPVLS